MREGGKSADAPESPEIFRTKCTAHMLHPTSSLPSIIFLLFITAFDISGANGYISRL
jgi:hypothetical protein